jgi:anthranilate phosphoribosyltransferase
MMGVRTFVNTIETLANPSRASVHLGSFYHLPYAKRLVRTFQRSETAAVERVLMFQGMEGYDDVRPGSTVVAEWDAEGALGGDASAPDDDGIADFEIETAAYGMDFESDDLRVDDVAADSARVTRAVLDGDRDDRFADAISLNAALRIYAAGDAPTIGDGLDAARAALEDGDAAAVLDELRAF